MCLNGIPSLIKVSPQRQVAVLLNNSAATCLELQQFEEALLHSSTVVLLQVADEGLLSKAPLWVSWWLSPLFNHRMEWGLFLDKANAAMLDSSGPVLSGMDTSRSRTGGIRG